MIHPYAARLVLVAVIIPATLIVIAIGLGAPLDRLVPVAGGALVASFGWLLYRIWLDSPP